MTPNHLPHLIHAGENFIIFFKIISNIFQPFLKYFSKYFHSFLYETVYIGGERQPDQSHEISIVGLRQLYQQM